jgi:S1-C subfamily serine protease
VSVKATGQGYFGQSEQTSWTGSGVIYSSDGKIITNNHVVYQAGYTVSSITVTLATGEQLPATLVGRDAMTEIAVIKVNPKTSLPAAKFDNNLPAIGDYAIAIGSPYGFENSVTMGIISGVNRKLDGTSGSEAAALSSLIQTDAPINSGNSGGALANENSEVVGINVAKLDTQSGAENLGFAIPSVVATTAADEIIKTGKVTHAYLGVSTQTVDSSMQQDFGLSSAGVLVAQVTANGPAAKAGIKQGDYILKIDSTTVSGDGDLLVAIRDKKPGDVVKVTIKRNNQQMTINVTLQERPASLQ